MIGPLPYIGGKNRLATKIISMLPEHTTYVETFAGGAQVLFHKPPSHVEVLNDLDYDVVNFFRVCQWHYEELIRYLRYSLVSRTLHELHVMTDPAALTDIQRADEQNLLATGECRDQRVRVVEVGVANTRTARAEGRKRGGSARRQYQLCRWHFLQQSLGDHPAERARGAGDDDAHEGSCGKAPAR